LALPLTVAAASGDKGDFEGHHGHRVERMAKTLDLNAEQKSKVEVIFKEQHEKLKAIHEETRTRLQEVLTKEQITKMDEMKKQRHEKWQKKHQEGQKAPEEKK